jgi:hypothetical protein
MIDALRRWTAMRFVPRISELMHRNRLAVRGARSAPNRHCQTSQGLQWDIRAGVLGWFARTDVRLDPRAISGREVAFAEGYSLLELERAGLTEDEAIAAGLTIDRERTSSLGSNVLQLEKLRRARL